MNERIKELVEQAFIITTDGKIGHVNNYMVEKFAELIVQECILTIQMGITRDGTKTEKFKRSMTHIKDIKEHFGVE
jgi:heme-binding NEAT domain protein